MRHELLKYFAFFGKPFGLIWFALLVPSFVFPMILSLAHLCHWLGLLHVPLPFCPVMASSSIFSSSCCRTLSFWEYASRSFEAVNLPHFLGTSLDRGSCFNLSVFDILNLKATEISSFSLSLEFVSFSSIFMFSHSCFGKCFLKPLRGVFFCGVGNAMALKSAVFACLILAVSSGAAATNTTTSINSTVIPCGQDMSCDNGTQETRTGNNMRRRRRRRRENRRRRRRTMRSAPWETLWASCSVSGHMVTCVMPCLEKQVEWVAKHCLLFASPTGRLSRQCS